MLKRAATLIATRRFGASALIVASLALAGGVVHAQGVPSPAAGPSVSTACNPSAVGGLLHQFGVQLGHNLGASDDQIGAAFAQAVQELQPQIAAQVQAVCGQASASGGIAGLAVPFQALLGPAAQALQLDPDTLRGDLQHGTTLRQLAVQQGVDPSALADQLTAAAEHLRVQQERETIGHLIDQPLGGQPSPAGQ
jgi:hypothetical protein